jgi:hypothetical protein
MTYGRPVVPAERATPISPSLEEDGGKVGKNELGKKVFTYG